MPDELWPVMPLRLEHFQNPPRDFGILPFWFLNGELDPDEMRYQLKEFREKGMPGIILHGRYGLEIPYLSNSYLERIRLAVSEAQKIGLKTWIYDEMNWPSGTADQRVLKSRPDLANRYLECITFKVRGPWFTYMTGADSRYHDYERSTPVAAFAIGSNGQVIDLTPFLSFRDVIPWEAPAGNWQIMNIVEKRAEYYIDALDPEATATFLKVGYEPYIHVLSGQPGDAYLGQQMPGFYTDEPAMYYFLSGADHPTIPWTKDMFRKFQERNQYNLRPRLPDLFLDLGPDSARVRYDFYNTLTELYDDAYYRQIHEYCQAHGVRFTGHLLYEEWLRKLIRVEGNPYKHYVHFDLPGVDHLYPFVGDRDRPDEHVALKLASSAAHQLGHQRLLCESFGGIFMDATMQRMKWIADWEHVLGVNVINPHGFHYTLEGPRKRDWPPSMFYQFPWWKNYSQFSEYISRLGYLLTGGRHAARTALLYPINALFGSYTPQDHQPLADRTEHDFNALTDLLLRLHYDYDYIDEDILAKATISAGKIQVQDETYELLVLPPLTHLKLETVARLEQFVAQGGRVLGTVFLPDQAFGPRGLVDISARMEALFGVNPTESQREYPRCAGMDIQRCHQPGSGKAYFLRSYAVARQLPLRLQQQLEISGRPEHAGFEIDNEAGASRYFFTLPSGERQEITQEVVEERLEAARGLQTALSEILPPELVIDNPDIYCLHRVKDEQDIYFLVNSTSAEQVAQVSLKGSWQPVVWDPSTGVEKPVAPWRFSNGSTHFSVTLPAVGSAFVLAKPAADFQGIEANFVVESITAQEARGYSAAAEIVLAVEQDGKSRRWSVVTNRRAEDIVLDGEWAFEPEGQNALVLNHWLAAAEEAGGSPRQYAAPEGDTAGWLPMKPGAWSYQLPAEPAQPYPLFVWYRASFQAEYLPRRADLIIDGFAGSQYQVYLNGQQIQSPAVRSSFDAQMKAVDIAPFLCGGENILAVRLCLHDATDGLLDLLKICGDFCLARRGEDGYAITAPRRAVKAASWTEQGYPFYSGAAVYRRSFQLPGECAGQRVFLEPGLADDVLEVTVNGRPAGARLWSPYAVELTEYLLPGENTLELRVANTLINLLEAVERPSGLVNPPRLVFYQPVIFHLDK